MVCRCGCPPGPAYYLNGRNKTQQKMMKRLFLLWVGLLVPCAPAQVEQAAVAPAVMAQAEDYPAKLLRVNRSLPGKDAAETPLATYEDAQGRRVDLVGVCHIGERRYYKQLNRILATYDRVLYELVDGEKYSYYQVLARKVVEGTATEQEKKEYEAYRKQVAEQKQSRSILSDLYSQTADRLKLVDQMSSVDYGYEHFVYADLSMEEFNRAMNARGESMLGLIFSAARESLSLDTLTSFSFRRDVVSLRRAFMKSMEKQSQKSVMEDSSIILDRNLRCMQVLDEQLKNPEVRKVAIFYGALHLRHFHEMLHSKGFTLKSVRWLPFVTVPKE